ncbi:Proteasome subunit alpha type-2 [Pichia californica]|uniref:mannose-1-phosphate guanylyltransferase n=1 Tax=Pichia californica TaxID=460514 RepID=A0A9P7BE25_9ASCO|nr:Proteasome subunit alpha type-2 [[Candida] californica]
MTSKAVIIIGGPSRGTRFRPLALDQSKYLFPIAGKPLLSHTIDAILKIDSINEILLIGFYENSIFEEFINEYNSKFDYSNKNCRIKYLKEFKALGTAGGLYQYKDEILKNNNSDNFLLIHGDIICSFPLIQMIEKFESIKMLNNNTVSNNINLKKNDLSPDAILFGVNLDNYNYDLMLTMSSTYHTSFGLIAYDSKDHDKVIHYVEKPESKISNVINGGIYLFNINVFKLLSKAKIEKIQKSNDENYYEFIDEDTLSIEHDILQKLPDLNKTYVFNYKGFWKTIKTPADAIIANELYLDLIYQSKSKDSLVKPSINISPPVFIDKSTNIDYTMSTKFGPYVSIGKNCIIGSGCRIINSIILENVEIGSNTIIKNSIISKNCKIGNWSRIEGSGMNLVSINELIRKNGTSKMKALMETNENFKVIGIRDSGNITILGSNVQVKDEVLVFNSFVLPSKVIGEDLRYEVIM